MPEPTETDPLGNFDPQFQTAKIAFDAEQLVDCEKCGRKNGPHRTECMYCGHAITGTDTRSGISLRIAESWEPAFNVVKSAGAQTASSAQVSDLLEMDAELLGSILETQTLMPLARVSDPVSANKLCRRLADFGITAFVISDADISNPGPPVRLSGLAVDDGRLTLMNFNTGGRFAYELHDIALLVKGRIRLTRLDSIEKKGRKGKTKLLDEFPTASDSFVLDLYVRDDPRGFRIQETGFDFSCLGDKKQLIAAENIELLCRTLVKAAPTARFVDAFDSVRLEINTVWPVEEQKDFKGLKRTGFGKMEFGSSSTVSNLEQFTRFSRLQWFSQ